jgi:hypothetical protein
MRKTHAKKLESLAPKEVAAIAAKIRAKVKASNSQQMSLPPRFNDALAFLMTKYHFTVEELSAESGISASTIKRMRNKLKYDAPLRHVIALCIAMGLSKDESYGLIERSGRAFTYSGESQFLRELLENYSYLQIVDCNEILEQGGNKPLSEFLCECEKEFTK